MGGWTIAEGGLGVGLQTDPLGGLLVRLHVMQSVELNLRLLVKLYIKVHVIVMVFPRVLWRDGFWL